MSVSVLWMSCAHSLGLRCVLRCGIRAIVFDSRYFLIRALVSILVGVISFVLVLLGTLGVGIFGIVFSMAAAWIGSVCVRCGCSFALGVTVVSLGSVSIGALAASSKVTLRCIGLVSIGVGIISGLLLRIVSSLFSASI